jgi:hypothetical protein
MRSVAFHRAGADSNAAKAGIGADLDRHVELAAIDRSEPEIDRFGDILCRREFIGLITGDRLVIGTADQRLAASL